MSVLEIFAILAGMIIISIIFENIARIRDNTLRDENNNIKQKNEELEYDNSRLGAENNRINAELNEIKNLFPNIVDYLEHRTKSTVGEDEHVFLVYGEGNLQIKKHIYLSLDKKYHISALYESAQTIRYINAADGSLSLGNLSLSADIVSGDHTYKGVTLDDCKCKDFDHRGNPCKHVLFLASCLGVMHLNENKMLDVYSKTEEKHKQAIADKEKVDASKKRGLAVINDLVKQRDKINNEIQSIKDNGVNAYHSIAVAIADIETACCKDAIDWLGSKERPALKAQQTVAIVKSRLSWEIEKRKIAELKLKRIKKAVPDINIIFEDEFNQNNQFSLTRI